jgi:hypothetical protein
MDCVHGGSPDMAWDATHVRHMLDLQERALAAFATAAAADRALKKDE